MFACLYIPDFLLQANLRDEPGALGQAIALVEGAFPRVVAATRAARETGVAPGMTKAQAAQFSAVRHRSRAKEESTRAALLDCAKSCSPSVEGTAADMAMVDLEGLEKLLGPPSEIAARLLSQAEELGLRIRVAIAANPDTAILAARGFQDVTVTPPGKEAQTLGELPVSVLNPPPETLDILRRWGIHRLKQLAGLPPLPLSERLGQEGVRLQELARGKRSRSLVISQDAERFEEAWELDNPVTTLEELDFVLSSLLTRISKRLAVRSLAAEALRLRLDLVRGVEPEPSLALEEQEKQRPEIRDERREKQRRETRDERQAIAPDSPLVSRLFSLSLIFPTPINNAQLFFKLWRLRLESDLPGAPVTKITITAQPARPRALQGGLFAPLAPDPEKLELTLARIAAVAGKECVGSPELLDTHRPHAFRMTAFNPAATSTRHPQEKGSRAGLSEAENPKFQIQNSKSTITCGTLNSPNLKFEIANRKSTSATGAPSKFEIENLKTGSDMGFSPNPKLKIQNPKFQIPNLRSNGELEIALRLFRPPVPARVELISGRPTVLSSSALRGRIFFAAGPWRKSGGWWEEEKWDREEWDVEIRAGKGAALYSIYYDLAGDQWYVEGEYD